MPTQQGCFTGSLRSPSLTLSSQRTHGKQRISLGCTTQVQREVENQHDSKQQSCIYCEGHQKDRVEGRQETEKNNWENNAVTDHPHSSTHLHLKARAERFVKGRGRSRNAGAAGARCRTPGEGGRAKGCPGPTAHRRSLVPAHSQSGNVPKPWFVAAARTSS